MIPLIDLHTVFQVLYLIGQVTLRRDALKPWQADYDALDEHGIAFSVPTVPCCVPYYLSLIDFVVRYYSPLCVQF